MGSTTEGGGPVVDRLREFALREGRIPTREEVRQIVAGAGATLDRFGRVMSPLTADAVATSTGAPTCRLPSPSGVGTSERSQTQTSRSTRTVVAVPNTPSPPRTPTGADGTVAGDQYPDPRRGGDEFPDLPVAFPSGDEGVRRAVDDLVDDWHRTGGELTRVDVDRIVTKRLLGGRQHAEILTRLVELGMLDVEPDPVRRSTHEPNPDEEVPRVAARVTRDQLDDYLRQIGRHALLRADDEVRLGRAVHAGAAAAEALATDETTVDNREALEQVVAAGRDAHQQMVVSNLRLVVSIARVVVRRPGSLDLADVVQHGNIGLMRAAEGFDPNLGFKFSTYATWWIRQAIDRGHANESRTIRYPVHFVEDLRRVGKARNVLSRRHDHTPTVDELATETQMTRAAVQAVIDYTRSVVSLDVGVGEDETTTLADLLAAREDPDHRFDPSDWALRAAMRRDIDDLLSGLLTPREVHIVRRRYGLVDGEIDTLDEIGDDFGLTRERIRQIQRKAVDKLAGSRDARHLYEYLVDRSDDLPAAPPGGWVDQALLVREDKARRAARRKTAAQKEER